MAGEPDWTLATWEGNRLAQHRAFQALSFRDKVRAIENLGEVTEFFVHRAKVRAVFCAARTRSSGVSWRSATSCAVRKGPSPGEMGVHVLRARFGMLDNVRYEA
jgi:hypothetical protein